MTMSNVAPMIEPDAAMMRRHAGHLFECWLDGCHHGRIELAWTDGRDGKLRHAAIFGTDELDELVDRAIAENRRPGQNVYVGQALRHPDIAPFGRCKDDEFFALTAFYADIDDDVTATASINYRNREDSGLLVQLESEPQSARETEPFLVSAVPLAAGVAMAPTKAADIEFNLDEETASEAVGLISAGGTRFLILKASLPCLLYQLRSGSPKLPSKLARIDLILKIDKKKISSLLERLVVLGSCHTVIGSLSWSWKVVSAAVDFSSSGATLKGQILIEHAAGSTFITFANPAQVAFIPATNRLYLSLQNGTVPISAYIDGTLRSLGSIQLASFYQVSLPMAGAIPIATGGNVSSTLSDVSFQFSANKLTVRADASFE